MKKIILNIIIITLSNVSYSQWNEDFSDNELSNNPLWRGETTKFIIDNGILQLNDTTKSGNALISTSFQPLEKWSASTWFKMSFNPSGNNYLTLRYYSSLDSSSYLELIVGGSSDDMRLYMESSGTRQLLIDGPDDMFDKTLNNGVVHIEKQEDKWSILFEDESLGVQRFVGTLEDSTAFPINMFEIECVYTSTRSDKFFFDDIRFSGSRWTDRIPPKLENLYVESDRFIKLIFDEPIFLYSSLEEFYIKPLQISPESYMVTDQNTVVLEFEKPLPIGEYLTLFIPPVYDSSDNFWTGESDPFIILSVEPTQYHDVLISEVMSDPTPAIGPYDHEYVELYNHSGRVINLSDWQFSDGNRSTPLPGYILFPETYIVLIPFQDCENTTVSEDHLCADQWPGINNSGEKLILKNEKGKVIDSVRFEMNWHDSDKASGGWSLERGSYSYRCQGSEIWKSSLSPSGGTPGRQNSFEVIEDDTLLLISSSYEGVNQLELGFSQSIFPDPSIISLYEGNNILVQESLKIDGIDMVITLAEPLEKNHPKELILENVQTCWSSGKYSFTISVVRTDSLAVGDLVINEVLFEPFPGGVDFIEVYNTSSKYLDLSHLMVEYMDGEGSGDLKPFTSEKWRIAPGEYKALTNEARIIHKYYPGTREENILEGRIPYLPVESGSIILRSPEWATIDSIFYHRDFHLQLLKDTKGVSLELINPLADPLLSANWHSAASTEGYATPGKANSHLRTLGATHSLSCNPQVVTIDRGMLLEPLGISFQLSESSWIGSVEIFDIAGFKIAEVVNNQTLSSESTIYWNGNVSGSRLLREGLYTVRLKAFSNDGKVVEKMSVFGLWEK